MNLTVSVVRHHGSNGDVSVNWMSIDKTAKNGLDFNGGRGVIKFEHGENQKFLMLPILNNKESGEVTFGIELYEPQGDSKLGDIRNTTVTVLDTGKQP